MVHSPESAIVFHFQPFTVTMRQTRAQLITKFEDAFISRPGALRDLPEYYLYPKGSLFCFTLSLTLVG